MSPAEQRPRDYPSTHLVPLVGRCRGIGEVCRVDRPDQSTGFGLTTRFGRGFSVDNLETMRLFFQTYSNPGSTISETPSRKMLAAGKSATSSRESELTRVASRFKLSWSHYVLLVCSVHKGLPNQPILLVLAKAFRVTFIGAILICIPAIQPTRSTLATPTSPPMMPTDLPRARKSFPKPAYLQGCADHWTFWSLPITPATWAPFTVT